MKNLKETSLFLGISLIFVFFSFSPTFFEITQKEKVPSDREFTLDHNYVFDFNFYISRIREGEEGRWLVSEKYYHKPHTPSLFQIVYLYLGKFGGILNLDPVLVYHAARIVFGTILLMSILCAIRRLFPLRKTLILFLLSVTGGSFPIFVPVAEGINFLGKRSATYMGWWSSQDSLQRITYIPHVLIGQIFLLMLIVSLSKKISYKKGVIIGTIGCIAGVIFPPALIILYAWFLFQTVFVVLFERNKLAEILPKILALAISGISIVYLQLAFKVVPWSTLATFDVRHRMPLPLQEYILSMGPVFVLSLVGGLLAVIRKEKKLFPYLSWIIANFFLIAVFWNMPTQSPLRFTQSALYIPSGILAGYLFISLWRYKIARIFTGISYAAVLTTGFIVMVSMVGWLTDQVVAKRLGTYLYPTGAVLIYPTRDFMTAIYYLKDNINSKKVVFAAETAGNFIPAYAGNYVYYGHANTPDDELKKLEIKKFYSMAFSKKEAFNFLKSEGISYVFYGIQEKEISSDNSMVAEYPFLKTVYENKTVVIYKVETED